MTNTPRKSLFFASICAAVIGAAAAFSVHAAITPTLALNNFGNGEVQVTVTGDQNAPVYLYYYTQSPSVVENAGLIGSTALNGYFSATLSYGQYNIPSGAYVYAIVDGAVSPTVAWPYNTSSITYANNNQITFSQNNVSVAPNQTLQVTMYGGSGAYYISQNSSLVSASVSGSTLIISGVSNENGSGSLIICSNVSSCGTLNLTVTAPAYTYPYTSAYSNPTTYTYTTYPSTYVSPSTYSYPNTIPSTFTYPNSTYAYQPQTTYPATYQTYPLITLNQGTLNIEVGQQGTLGIYGNGQGYFIFSGSNSYAATASVNGSTLLVNGIEPGESTIMVCENVSSSCTSLYVTVSPLPAVNYNYAPSYSYAAQQPYYYPQTQPATYSYFQPVTRFFSNFNPYNWGGRTY